MAKKSGNKPTGKSWTSKDGKSTFTKRPDGGTHIERQIGPSGTYKGYDSPK